MSLGDQTALSTLRVGEKSIEAIMKLLKFLIEFRDKRIDSRIKKIKLLDIKSQEKELKAIKRLKNKAGYVNAKLLHSTGKKILAGSMKLNDEQLSEFSRYAKLYNVVYSSVSDPTIDGEKKHIFFFKEEDLATIKIITDRMTENLNLKKMTDRIEELEKIEERTPEEEKELAALKIQKSEYLRKGVNEFNNSKSEEIFKQACDSLEHKSVTFERGLNRLTDRDFSREQNYYICERTNPSRYIQLYSELDTFRGQEYTRTSYSVFKDDQQVGEFSDRRFEGRPKNYWYNIREQMREKGGFSDDVVIFNSEDEFMRYKELFFKERFEELSCLKVEPEAMNYSNVIDELEAQLQKNGFRKTDDGVFCIKTNTNINELTPESIEEKMRISESALIGQQIDVYNQMAEQNFEMTQLKNQYDTIDLSNKESLTEEQLENTPDLKTIYLDYENQKKAFEDLKIKAEKYISQRELINSVQVQKKVEHEYDFVRIHFDLKKEHVAPEVRSQLDDVQNQIEAQMQAISEIEIEMTYISTENDIAALQAEIQEHRNLLSQLNYDYSNIYNNGLFEKGMLSSEQNKMLSDIENKIQEVEFKIKDLKYAYINTFDESSRNQINDTIQSLSAEVEGLKSKYATTYYQVFDKKEVQTIKKTINQWKREVEKTKQNIDLSKEQNAKDRSQGIDLNKNAERSTGKLR